MTSSTLFGLCGAVLIGLGLYGLMVRQQPLRKIVAMNILSSGVFVVFGVIARRGTTATMDADPVPHALAITGIVVAFGGSALAVALVQVLFQRSGRATLRPEEPEVDEHPVGGAANDGGAAPR